MDFRQHIVRSRPAAALVFLAGTARTTFIPSDFHGTANGGSGRIAASLWFAPEVINVCHCFAYVPNDFFTHLRSNWRGPQLFIGMVLTPQEHHWKEVFRIIPAAHQSVPGVLPQ